MMKSRLLIVAVLFVGSSIQADEVEPHPNDCGPNSLVLLLRLSGRDVALDAVEQALPRRHDSGYSLAELLSAASKFGIRLGGIRVERRDLPLIHPAIAYLSNAGEGHFVLLRPVGMTGKMVQVLDPPSAPAVVDYEQLLSSQSWTGQILLQQTPRWWFNRWIWLGIPCALLLAGSVMRIAAYFWVRSPRGRCPQRLNEILSNGLSWTFRA